MPLVHVDQGDHYDGCFVACVAIVMQCSYQEAFALVHPKRVFHKNSHGIKRLDPDGPIRVAITKLKRLGLSPQVSTRKRIDRLPHTAIGVIRWSWAPELLHAFVWDAETKTVLDPAYRYPLDIKSYQRQLATILYVEPVMDVHAKASTIHS